ncbi:hypothetical protein NDI39_26910 [Microcoleus sp. ZQ-A2]|nr:hypothetical protein [Microcoleus sp. FACHB-1]
MCTAQRAIAYSPYPFILHPALSDCLSHNLGKSGKKAIAIRRSFTYLGNIQLLELGSDQTLTNPHQFRKTWGIWKCDRSSCIACLTLYSSAIAYNIPPQGAIA